MDRDELISRLIARIEMLEEVVYRQDSGFHQAKKGDTGDVFIIPNKPDYIEGGSHHEECIKVIEFLNSHHISNDKIIEFGDNFSLLLVGDELSVSEERTAIDIIRASKGKTGDVF